jgi:hypothetical protein
MKRQAGGDAAPVEVRLQDEPDYRWRGRLDFTDNGLDPRSGTIRGRAVLRNPGLFLTPGMFGNMRMSTGAARAALLVPDAAITTDQARRVVQWPRPMVQSHPSRSNSAPWSTSAHHPLRPEPKRSGRHRRGAARFPGVKAQLRPDASRPRPWRLPHRRPKPPRRRGDARPLAPRRASPFCLQPTLPLRSGGELMRFSRFFITRPIFAAAIAIVITLIGGIAYLGLPVANIPTSCRRR